MSQSSSSRPAESHTVAQQPTRSSLPPGRPLEGVVICLSGYQNPLRSELRDKALSLGASYRQDWGPSCTHLICAFANTPKFKEVKGKGIIVSDKWIQECHDKKTMLNWRPYRVGRAPSPPNNAANVQPTGSNDDDSDEPSSSSPRPATTRKSLKRKVKSSDDEDWNPKEEGGDEEEDDEDEEAEDASAEEMFEPEDESDSSDRSEGHRTKRATVKKQGKAAKPPSSSTTHTTAKRPKPAEATVTSKESKAAEVSEWTPVRRKGPSVALPHPDPNEEDTDDEIQRVLDKPENASATTDREDLSEQNDPADLPEFFEGKHFFLHVKDIPADEERLLQRLIIAFAGNLHPYMHTDVQYVITRSAWNEEFDNTLKDNSSLIFVRPDWIFACDQQARLVPFQKFLVVG